MNLRRKFWSYFRFVFFFAGFFDFAATVFFPADFGLDFDLCNTLASVLPISAGLCTVWIPAARMALYFSTAVPCPPLIIAPAWPIRRPGGAVCPQIKPTTGFLHAS